MTRFAYKHDGEWCINGPSNTTFSGEAVDQLAAYEDTKLTPDQVDQIRRAAEYMMFPSVGDFMRYAISNFEELQRLQKSELLEVGHWRNVMPYDEFLYFADCSHCNKTVVIREDTVFCPACGWHMTWKREKSEPSSFLSSQPLSLDELKQMEGRPVWVKVIDHSVFKDPKDDFDGWGMVRKSWVRIWDEKRADLIHIDYDFESYGKEWLAYAMPVKFGQWEYDSEKDIYFCSECKQEPAGNCNGCTSLLSEFCPNCGTLMAQDGKSCAHSGNGCEPVHCKDCVSSGRNQSGVLICQNQLCPCYNREVFPKFSCICGESRTNYVSEGGNTDD